MINYIKSIGLGIGIYILSALGNILLATEILSYSQTQAMLDKNSADFYQTLNASSAPSTSSSSSNTSNKPSATKNNAPSIMNFNPIINTPSSTAAKAPHSANPPSNNITPNNNTDNTPADSAQDSSNAENNANPAASVNTVSTDNNRNNSLNIFAPSASSSNFDMYR